MSHSPESLSSRDAHNKIKHLEGLQTVLIDEDSEKEFFEKDKIRRVPLFLESLRDYYAESEASISQANIKSYDNLHFAREEDGTLIGYVYKSKLVKPKSATEVMLDRYS